MFRKHRGMESIFGHQFLLDHFNSSVVTLCAIRDRIHVHPSGLVCAAAARGRWSGAVSGAVHDGRHDGFRTRLVLPRHPRLVLGCLQRADIRAGGCLARDRRGFGRAGRRAHRIGQDARRVPRRAGPAGRGPAARRGEEALPRAVRIAPEGPRGRRGAQSALTADRDPPGIGAARAARARGAGGHPLGGHAARRAPLDGDPAAGHPDHHPRVAVPDADLLGSGGPVRGSRR